MPKILKNPKNPNTTYKIYNRDFKTLIKEWKPDLILIIILFLLTCIFFWKILLNPDQMTYFSDTYRQFYPWRFFMENNYIQNQLPLWLPYSSSGEPFIGNIQTAIFYPVNIAMFSIFPTYLAFGYSYLLHIFLAGLFMYIFMRYIKLDKTCSLLSSIIFMYSGFLITHTYAGHYTVITAACWIPLIFLLFEIALNKKSLFYGLLIGIPIGLQLLAGHMQTSFYTLIALGLYLIFRLFLIIRANRDYKLSQHITRAGGTSYEFAASYSFPIQNFITFVSPDFFGNPVDGTYWHIWNYWELSLYIGILTLILISFAIYFKRKNKYVLFFTGLASLSLLLALGSNTPIYWLLWRFAPGFDMFRVPSRFLFLFTFSASILAGFGFNFLKGKLTLQEQEKIWKFIKIFAVLTLLLVCTIVAIYITKDQIIQFGQKFLETAYVPSSRSIDYYLQNTPLFISNIISDLLILLVLSIISVGVLVFALQIKKNKPFKFKCFSIKPKSIFKVIVILFILSNLWFYHMGFIDTKDPEEVYSEADYVVFLKNNSDNYRVFDLNNKKITDNFQIIYGIQEITGYNPLTLNNYDQFLKSIHNLSDNQNHPILDLLNAKYILSSKKLNNSGFKLVFDKNNTYIYENENVLPRAFVIYNVSVKSEKDVISNLKNPSFNPVNTLLIDSEIDNLPSGNKTYEPVEILKYSPNEIILQTNITQPGFLVLSEIYYPDWNAYVDGVQKEIFRAYHTLRAINLDEGLHTVRFSCSSSSLDTGKLITFLTIIFLVIVISVKIIFCFKKSLDSVRRK